MTRHTGSPSNTNLIAALRADRKGDPDDPLADVVDACREGHREAQRQLYDACHRKIYRLMVRMVGEQDAADLTQQVFLQMFRKLNQFNGRARFDTWLYRLAINEALQHLRRSQRRRTQDIQGNSADSAPSHELRLENRELLELALARLDPDLRSVFLLRELQGLSYHNIALALDVPEGTVGSRLNRARCELRQHLVQMGWQA